MAGLFGPDDVRRIAEAALDLPGADGVDVLLMHQWGGLTRFANSSIHQSTWREDTGVRVRAITGGRAGVTSTNDFSKDGARRAAASALEMAQVAAPDPLFPGLAPKAGVPEREGSFDEATAAATPEQRAEGVASLVAQLGEGFHAAGAFETSALEVALANTEGQFCYAPSTQSSLTTVVSGGDGAAGAAEVAAMRVSEVDPQSIGRRAFQKAREGQGPREVDPGTYQVVLEPLAVATLVSFLSYMGLGGRGIAEGRSPFSGKAGEKDCHESIQLYDQPLSPLTIGLPFDFDRT